MPLGNPNAPEDVAEISSASDVTIGWDAASILYVTMTATGKKLNLPGDPTKSVPGFSPGRGHRTTGKVTVDTTKTSPVPMRDPGNEMRRGRVLIANVGSNSFVIGKDNIYGQGTDDTLGTKKAQRFVYVPGKKLKSDSKRYGYWAKDGAEYQIDD